MAITDLGEGSTTSGDLECGVGLMTGCEDDQPLAHVSRVESTHKFHGDCYGVHQLLTLPDHDLCYTQCDSWSWDPSTDEASVSVTAHFEDMVCSLHQPVE